MILYYAMGGGLGHLSRSLAILQGLPQSLVAQVRLLASSRHTALIRPYSPCPVDIVAGEILTSRRAYLRYLENYLKRYQISTLVLDTFPFGIVGEWLDVALSLPRMLIARSLKWEPYQERIRHREGAFPQYALVIERLQGEYFHKLRRESQLTPLDAPILLPTGQPGPPERLERRDLLIVHSGDTHERETLEQVAREQRNGQNERFISPDCIFPEQGIYPAERVMSRYRTIVAAAGYNMIAIASQASPDRRFILHPFPRRFDDQFLRLERFEQRQWPWRQEGSSGREQAAAWLTELIGSAFFNDSHKTFMVSFLGGDGFLSNDIL